MPNKFLQFILITLLLVLESCASNDDGPVIFSGTDGDESGGFATDEGEVGISEIEELMASSDDPFVRQGILADMLYEARVAYEDNRLMSPPGNNAYDGFRAILDFDPENEVALQGMRDIVLRYVQLADAAIQVRQFDNAGTYLNRAIRIGGNTAAVEEARRRLAQARDIQMDIFQLDDQALSERGLEIMVELGEIGQYIQDREATFVINARSDEEGRWIYRIMREAVGGYRLRGDIAVDSTASVQVVVPQT